MEQGRSVQKVNWNNSRERKIGHNEKQLDLDS